MGYVSCHAERDSDTPDVRVPGLHSSVSTKQRLNRDICHGFLRGGVGTADKVPTKWTAGTGRIPSCSSTVCRWQYSTPNPEGGVRDNPNRHIGPMCHPMYRTLVLARSTYDCVSGGVWTIRSSSLRSVWQCAVFDALYTPLVLS